MGLGIHIGASIKPRRLLRRRRDQQDVLRRIADSLTGWIGHPLHNKLAAVSLDEGGLHARLHPSEESVDFSLESGDMLTVSAKTSSAGPGYHAFLVDLLDRIGEECGLAWVWDDDDREYLDETGYAGARDFSGLQQEMAAWLRGLANMLVEKDDGCNWSLSMPLGFRLVGGHFAISTMGFWDRPWFESAARASGDALLKHASEFFPWWSRDRDAQFWLRCGLVKCWVDLPWRPALNDAEQAESQTTLECFAMAKRMNVAAPLPKQEIEELRSLLSSTEAARIVPTPDRIGFRRRPMRRGLGGAWSIVLPGYYHESIEEEGSLTVYSYGGRTIQGSCYKLQKQAGEAPGDGISHEGSLHFKEGHLTGSAHIEPVEEDGHSFWILQGTISTKTSGTGTSICFLTICFEDPKDRDWAVETWKSVYRGPAEEEAPA